MKDTPRMTPELASKAKTLVTKLGLKQHQAAALLGVNQGRISEVISGKRFAGVPPCPPDQIGLDL
jgi:predicted XRE-type DNA-binding protein